MKSQDFTTTMVVEATPSEVFNAVNNVRGWWSENIEGATDALNSEFSYHYQDVHRSKMKITDFVSNEVVVWHVLDNYFKFTTDETEWKGTHVVFEISGKDGKTQLTFTHQGLVPEYECFKICRDAWTHYIQGSLKDLIVKGKGDPTPRDAGNESAEKQSPKQQLSADQGVTKSISHRLLIESPVETIYKALTTEKGLAGWWTPDTTVKPEAGGILRFAFGPDYFKEMRAEELKPYNKVKWRCLKGHEEWIGTTITFELEPHRKGSTLFFHHDKWKAATQEFAGCSYDWALFLRSLKLLCETGKGLPYPDFRK